MSIEYMNWVWRRSKATGTDLLVLLALADHANEDGESWPSIAHIARKSRCDTRTAQRRIRRLERLGEVIVLPGRGRTSTAGGTKSNRYVIVISEGDERGGSSPGGGSDAGDGVAPVPGGGVAPVPPEPSSEPPGKRHTLATTFLAAEKEISSELTRAVIAACRIDDNALTASAKGALNKAVKELREVGATPEQVWGCKDRWTEKWPDGELTPQALAKHWPMLKNAAPHRKPWEA